MSENGNDTGGLPSQTLLSHTERIAIVETRLNSVDRAIAIAASQMERSAERMENATLKFTAEAVKLNTVVDEMRRQVTMQEAADQKERERLAGDLAVIQKRIARESGEHAALDKGRQAQEVAARNGLSTFVERHAVKLIAGLILALVSVLAGRASSTTAPAAKPEEIAARAVELFAKQQAQTQQDTAE